MRGEKNRTSEKKGERIGEGRQMVKKPGHERGKKEDDKR